MLDLSISPGAKIGGVVPPGGPLTRRLSVAILRALIFAAKQVSLRCVALVGYISGCISGASAKPSAPEGAPANFDDVLVLTAK